MHTNCTHPTAKCPDRQLLFFPSRANSSALLRYVTLMVAILLILPIKVLAKSPTFQERSIFNPSIRTIEINNTEPFPGGTFREVQFGIGGGGCHESFPGECDIYGLDVQPSTSIHWNYTPKYSFPFGTLDSVACGYAEGEEPNAELILPSGKKETLPVSTLDNVFGVQDGCYIARISSFLGMELGNYTLTFEHPLKDLTRTITVTYPDSEVVVYAYRDDKLINFLMGFRPNSELTLRFYVEESSETEEVDQIGLGSYVASRTITTDENGVAAIEVQIARSSPYQGQRTGFVVDAPNPMYSYAIVKVPHTGGDTTTPSPCFGFELPSRLSIGMSARVLPGDPNLINSKPSRPSKHADSRSIGKIPSGQVATVIDGPACRDNIVWWKVQYNGITGWTGEGEGAVYWLAPAK